MPVPQRVNFLVEQASCLLSENGARCEFKLNFCLRREVQLSNLSTIAFIDSISSLYSSTR
ncbi:hypothetical protein QUA11_00185 [Microcoleus sp. S13_D1]